MTDRHSRTAQALLSARGFDSLDERTMVLARIDREEPNWAGKATHALHAEGITAEIRPGLREAIDEEWTWVNHPTSGLSRGEIHECSNQAQKIPDAIRDGRLVPHAHAHAETGWDTVAVGTCRDTGKSVHLHGENHLRHVTGAFAPPAQVLIAHARTSLTPPDTAPTDTGAPLVEQVATTPPTRRPRSRLQHLPQPQRRLGEVPDSVGRDDPRHPRVPDPAHRERPRNPRHRNSVDRSRLRDTRVRPHVGLTATGATPRPNVGGTAESHRRGDGWDAAIGAPVDEKMVTAATQPLSDAGWKHNVDGRWIRWTSPTGDADLQFDAFTTQHPSQNLATWTAWAGPPRTGPRPSAGPPTPRVRCWQTFSQTLAHRNSPAADRGRRT